jgi:hypothetical protein
MVAKFQPLMLLIANAESTIKTLESIGGTIQK